LTEDRLTPRALGLKGEAIALAVLRKKKYAVVETGYRLFRGEIDIIAYDGTTLVFVEVKTRAGTDFGLPEDAVTPAKQSQIKRIARGYLAAKGLEDADCRFDVVAILFADDGRWTLTHFEDAF
jgi:putative endonuclease